MDPNIEETNQQDNDIVSLIKEYISTRIEIIKLTAIERVSTVLPALITSTVLILLIVLAWVFGSVTLALYIGDQLDSITKGFGVVTFLYVVFGLIIYFIRGSVERKLTDRFVKGIFQNKK
jgi:hypothetical protein